MVDLFLKFFLIWVRLFDPQEECYPTEIQGIRRRLQWLHNDGRGAEDPPQLSLQFSSFQSHVSPVEIRQGWERATRLRGILRVLRRGQFDVSILFLLAFFTILFFPSNNPVLDGELMINCIKRARLTSS